MAFALRDGLGIGGLPLWTALPWLREGTLTRVLPTYHLSLMQIHALYTSREYLDAKIRSWIDFCDADWLACLAAHSPLDPNTGTPTRPHISRGAPNCQYQGKHLNSQFTLVRKVLNYERPLAYTLNHPLRTTVRSET
jgi:LysR substrate binding domain